MNTTIPTTLDTEDACEPGPVRQRPYRLTVVAASIAELVPQIGGWIFRSGHRRMARYRAR